MGLAAAVLAAVASVLVYLAARAVGVPTELTEVLEDHFARMPVMNMAWAALLEAGWPAPHWRQRVDGGPGAPGRRSWHSR